MALKQLNVEGVFFCSDSDSDLGAWSFREARAAVRHTFDLLHVHKHVNRGGNC